MAFLVDQFEGFSDTDFSVYRPAAWASNLHNLDRMRTKGRLMGLAKRVSEALAALGLEPALVLDASSEVPSLWNHREVRDQWAYFWRAPAARDALIPAFARVQSLAERVHDPAEHHRHALLSLRLDVNGFEAGLRLNTHASVDLDNLLGRLRAQPDDLAALLANLPEGLTLDGAAPTVASIEAAARATRAGQVTWLSLGLHLPAAAAIEAGAELAAQTTAALTALRPVMHWLAWHPENDHVGVGATLTAFADDVAARAQAETERAQVEATAREATAAAARERTAGKLAADEAWRRLQRANTLPDGAGQPPRAERAERAPRPEASPRAEGTEAPADGNAPRPERGPRPDGAGPRPERGPRPEGAGPRPERGPRPEGAGPRPERGPRPEGAGPRPERGPRPEGAGPRPERGPRPEGAGPRPERGPRPDRPARPERSPRPESEAAAPQAEAPARKAAPMAVGDRVRLLRGLLAGKEGVVTALAAKGYVTVQVGSLAMPVAANDLEPRNDAT